MKKFISFLFCVLLSMYYYAQPSIEWQKSLGGSSQDLTSAIQETTDGGYIVVGYAASSNGDVSSNHGDHDYWVVKLTNNGNISWEKSLGGSDTDIGTDIKQTIDGGYIVTGYSRSTDGDVTGNHGGHDYWVVKLDSSGNISWEKSYGGTLSDFAQSIQQTSDGGYIVAGYSYSTNGDVSGNLGAEDMWIVKLDSLGALIWEKSLGGSVYDRAHSIQQTTDGGYIVAGYTYSSNTHVSNFIGVQDVWVVKLDSMGAISWEKTYGGTDEDLANEIQQTSDGGYIILGHTKSNDVNVSLNKGLKDIWAVKITNIGVITWETTLGGTNWDYGYSINETSDSGFVLVGNSWSNNGDILCNYGGKDLWSAKLDINGSLVWKKCLGGSNDEFVSSVKQTSGLGYVIAGTSSSIDNDVSGNHGGDDYWIVKLSPYVGISDVTYENQLNIYPNPTNNTITIDASSLKQSSKNFKIECYNSLSQMVYSNKNSLIETINVTNWKNGIYFIRITNSETSITKTVIVNH